MHILQTKHNMYYVRGSKFTSRAYSFKLLSWDAWQVFLFKLLWMFEKCLASPVVFCFTFRVQLTLVMTWDFLILFWKWILEKLLLRGESEEEAVEGVQRATSISLLPVLLLVTQQRVLVVAVGPRRVGVGREGVSVAVERLSLEVPSQQSLWVRMVVVHKHHCYNKRSPPCSLNTLF